MKNILKKLACLALALSCLLAATGAAAAPINTVTITMPSAEWEAAFLKFLAIAEEGGIGMTDDPTFVVVEHPDRDAAFRYEHCLNIAGFMQVAYYDDGVGTFHSAILTINLDHGGAPEDTAWLAIYFTILAGDATTTQEELAELMEALCPIFSEVFSGEERVNGAQAATLRGVGYAMEINEEERFARLFTNATLEGNGTQ